MATFKQLTISFTAGAMLGAAIVYPANAEAATDYGDEHLKPMTRCQYEDGSDVIPDRADQCVWIDPDTGDMYINPTPEEVDNG